MIMKVTIIFHENKKNISKFWTSLVILNLILMIITQYYMQILSWKIENFKLQ